VTKDFDMKAFIAACIAVDVPWAVDVEMNGGRYSDVVKRARVYLSPALALDAFGASSIVALIDRRSATKYPI
jgi:hypothetical protein